MTSVATSRSVDWETVLRLIPGYDPFATAGDCRFDEEAADQVVGFFSDCLVHVKGEWAGHKIELAPWQQSVVGNLFGWKRPDGTRRFREALIFVPRKNGKALWTETPIPTPGGWTSMGDLEVGDQVFDETGATCTVTFATEVMDEHTCYEMWFSDGTSIVADAGHLWETVTRRPDGRRGVHTTEEIRTTLTVADRPNHTIPQGQLPERQITAVEPTRSVPVRCIQVNSPNHLYLAGEGMVPTHNTVLASGLALYAFFCDGEPGAEVYCAAADREQAKLLWDVSRRQILAEPTLALACKLYQHSIVIDSMGSSFKAISADAHTKHGYNSHFVVVDELHAQPTSELVDVLLTSTGARRQPLVVYLTTSDFERPSVCNEKHEYASKVRDRVIEDRSFLPVIYEAPRDADWTDPEVWASVNPNLGVSVSFEYLERECKRAQEQPSYQNTFQRLHLNIKTQADVAWLTMADWDACAEDFSPDDLEGRPCFAGLDLASTQDLTAFVLYFAEDEGAVLPFFWVPREGALKREKRDRVPYTAWARDGYLTLTEGNVCDYDAVRLRIRELADIFEIREIAFDRWGAQQLVTNLKDDGHEVVAFGQGYASMSAPSKELEKLVVSGALRHNAHPVLRWCASNVMVETDPAGNIKPSKKKSRERIDGIVALAMAIGRATEWRPPEPVVRIRRL